MKNQPILKDKRFFWQVMFLFQSGAVLNGIVCLFLNGSMLLCFLLLESVWLVFICGMLFTIRSLLKRRTIQLVHMSKRVLELEIILENIPASVIGIDKNGAITFLNKAAEKILEKRLAEVLGKRLTEFIKTGNESAKEFSELIKNTRLTKEPYFFYEQKMKTLSEKKSIISGFICPVDYSAITGALLVFSDETEKKLRENELSLNADKIKTRYEIMKNILSILPLGILVVNRKTSDVIYANRMFRKIHDISPTVPVLKSTVFRLMSINLPYRQYLVDGSINKGLYEAGNGWFDTTFFTGNGECRNVSINSQICTDSDMKVISVLEKKGRNLHKKMFREIKRDYLCAMENSIDGIVIIDQHGRIACWSASMEEFTGIDRINAVNRPIWEIEFEIQKSNNVSTMDQRQNKFLNSINKYYRVSEVEEFQNKETVRISNIYNNNTYIMKVTSGIYVSDNEIRMYKIFRNITEQVQIQKRLSIQKAFMANLLSATVNMLFIYDLLQNRLIFISSSIKDTKAEMMIYPERSFPDRMPIHPQDKNCYLEYIEKLKTAKNNDVLSHIYRAGFSEGEWKWYLRRDMVYCRHLDGKVKQILGSVTNIKQNV